MRVAAACVAALLVAGPAAAGGIAIESYTGDRPADASRLLSPILDELATRGFAAGDTLARTYETAVSRPAQTPAGLPPDFVAQAERGFKSWVAGKFDDALKLLGPLVEQAHANPGAFAKDQTLREPLLKALIALGLAQQRTGDPGAMRATFAEILRSFPDTQPSRATYGPDAFDAFEQVRRETAAGGRGKLTVKIADNAVVFVDEAFRAVGPTTADLVPGEYRVCVMLDKHPSRSHRASVRAGLETVLAVDAKLDQIVHTSGWTGFSFAAEADRDSHEPAYAAELANAIGASAVAVVGIDQVRGHPAIVGSLVSLQTGHEIRRASIALDPDPSTDRLRALARFLAGDEPAVGLEVQLGDHARGSADDVRLPSGEPRHHWGGTKWLVGGVAVGALGAGAVLIALDGRCKQTPMMGRPCNDVYSTGLAGYLTLGGGVMLAGLAVYLWLRHDDVPARTAYVSPTAGGAIAGYATSW